MEQESLLSGGVALFHTMVDGKHCYEVGKVLTTTLNDFGRKGDKLLMINGVETQHLPPEKFVKMLSSGSPLLTMHRASIIEAENNCPESESIRPYHKERTVLCFSLTMVSEPILDKDEKIPQVPEESECGSSDKEDNSYTDEEMLLVSMTNTSVTIVRGRGCDASSSCSCGGTGCTINELVMAPAQSKITSVYREYIRKHLEKGQVLIQSLLQNTICLENISRPRKEMPHIHTSTTANFTIYYYMSNAPEDFDRGVPVVLNFSGSTNFLKCICENDRPVLTVECYEKNRLQSINKGDPSAWPFVFYLKTSKSNHRHFESAAYSGWFIHTKPSGLVDVEPGTNYQESSFYIFIRS